MTRERIVFAAAVFAVWAAVGPARTVAGALRGADVLSSFVGLAFGGVLLALGWALTRTDEAPPPTLLLATALAAALLFSRWELPEERFHLVLYPPLGWLALRAVGERSRGVRSGLAIGLVLLAGVGDEMLQGAHPERQFDWMDVLANGLGGAVVPLLALGGRAGWIAPAALLAVALLFAPIQRTIGVAGLDVPGDALAPAPVPVFAPGPSQPAEPLQTEGAYDGHNLVLITIDALRADHVPPLGRAPVATPAMDQLAEESSAFAGIAAGTWTSPSMVSLLSGLHPAVHGVDGRGLDIAPGPALPLEQLAAAGWEVVGHAGDATENYRNLGIETELDRADEAAALRGALEGSEKPVFAWVHLRDVHAPYDATPGRLAELGLPSEIPAAPILERARTHFTVPRAAFPGRHDWLRPVVRALYAAEVADADAALAGVLAAIEASGESHRTLVVLTADHGEELLENDGIGHASTTLDSVPRPVLQEIPMLIRLPDGVGAGTRPPTALRQQDLLPSLLPMLGVQISQPSENPALVGVDLSEQLLGKGGAEESPGLQWFVSSPCGWQCPPDRRGERVAAVEGQPWEWCRYSASDEAPPCAGRLGSLLLEARQLGATLQTPVPAE